MAIMVASGAPPLRTKWRKSRTILLLGLVGGPPGHLISCLRSALVILKQSVALHLVYSPVIILLKAQPLLVLKARVYSSIV